MRKAPYLAFLAVLLLLPVIGVYVHLERQVEQRFSGTLFSVPSRVYSRPLALARGMNVKRLEVVERLEALGYRAVESEPEPGEYELGQRHLIVHRRESPGRATQRIGLRLSGSAGITRVTADREVVRHAEIEPEQIGELHGEIHISRRLRTLEDLPPHLIEAVIELEDQHFHEHEGLDLKRIAGAALANLRAGRIVQGGSTITQQLVKNFFLVPERTLSRKLHEVGMALILELHHDKNEILQAYLNEIYLGQRGSVAVHGVGEGAWHYFGKTPDQLTLAEAALLAGVIAAPGRFSPYQDPQAALSRRSLVLGLLHGRERITEREYAEALSEPLELSRFAQEGPRAPYFIEYLRRQLPETMTAHQLEREGLRIESTLDPQLQRFAVQAVQRGLSALEKQSPSLVREDAPLQAALVAIDVRSGEVLAHVGGRDYGQSQFDRATQALRQPGSIFKPIVALAAFTHPPRDDAAPFTLLTQLPDEELEFDTGILDEPLWKPANFDGEFRGPVTLRQALEKSINVPFARLGLEVGPRRVVRTARKLGITSRLRSVASISLGSSEVTLMEMTRAYAVLAAGGVSRTLRAHHSVRDAGGELLQRTESTSRRVFPEAPVYLVTSALQGVVERGTGAGLRALGVQVPLAGKTGTTNDSRDAWFIGYTPDLAVGVWVGFDDGQSIELTGARAALPIFADFMRAATRLRPRHDFATPHGVEVASVNDETGLMAGSFCEGHDEVFVAGTAPTGSCLPPVAAGPARAAAVVGRTAEQATRPLRWLLDQIFGTEDPRAPRHRRRSQR